jgi:alpha-beta hydrolase superfamily lysophospholipase
MDTGYANINNLNVPTLVLYGAHDQVIPPEPIYRALHKSRAPIKVAYYSLGYHMLLRDLHGDVPVRDIFSWMDDPSAPLPSGSDVAARKFLK